MSEVKKMKSVKFKGSSIKINKISGSDYADYEWSWKRKGKRVIPYEGRVDGGSKGDAISKAKRTITKQLRDYK